MPVTDNALALFKAFPTDKGDGNTIRSTDWVFAIEKTEAGDAPVTFDLAVFDDEFTAKTAARQAELERGSCMRQSD